MKTLKSQFLISATSSGSGKTTITLGLLRALKRRGLATQPFKCGPDYIDTKFHEIASGLASINLDTFMASEPYVSNIYRKYSLPADVSITEGVMGMYDGYDGIKGSSADIARLVNIPVVLVINAKSMAHSVAPIIYGYKNYRKDVDIVGVIFNFVSSESHYSYLKNACEEVGVESLGYLPKESDIEIPSRHLGLSLDSQFFLDNFINKVADIVEKHINIDKLLQLTQRQVTIELQNTKEPIQSQLLDISIAHDEAFNFMYKENVERFREKGTVTYFSPIRDKILPANTNFLYIPGGYPELYLKELSENKEMIKQIKQYIEGGGYVLAECGGMMYLSSAIIDQNGKRFEMVDIFKQDTTFENMKLTMGYRQVNYGDKSMRGHEFHYSRIVEEDKYCLRDIQIENARRKPVNTKIFYYRNAIATYAHIYWAEQGLIKFLDMLITGKKSSDQV